MATNALITPNWVTKEVARILVNNLKFAANVNRSYDDQFVHDGAKVGYTVNARLPQRFTTNKGQALVVQGIQDTVVPITLTDQANVGMAFSTASLTMEVDDYRTRYITPAASQLANTVDYDGLWRCYKEVWAQVGTLGTPPATQATVNQLYLNAGVALSNAACPVDQRCLVVSPAMMANLVGNNLALFNPTNEISDAFRKGQFAANVLGFEEMYQDQNTARRTSAAANTATVAGAGQTGNTITTTALSAALNQGDVITLLGVDQVNPQNYSDVGSLQKFTLLAGAASGATSIVVSPPIVTSGPFQTVTASPANGATITVVSPAATGDVGLGFHPDAFALVMADLDMPQGVWAAERVRSKELGISIRFVKAYDIYSDQSPARMDILYGWKTIRPELAVRIES
jgi:hypothetical protein